VSRPSRLAVPLAVLALTVGLSACGGSSDGEAAASSAPASSSSSAFPVTIENRFGTTEIPAEPERVVTVGYNDEDFVLALGVVPVGVRDLIGDYDAPARPWAQEQLGGAEIPTVGSTELDVEAIAALDPDLIVGVYSFMDQGVYDQLSKIAPTLAQTDEYADGATPWQQQTMLTGQALGREDQAQQLVDDVEGRFADAISANPDFAGKQLAVDLTGVGSGHYLLGSDDLRSQFFTDLGFAVPAASTDVSQERMDSLDADVLAVNGYTQADADADPLLSALDVVTSGRTVLLGGYDGDVSAALGFGSPLSLPFLLEQVVPALSAAADGDPATTVTQLG
jgi:iron complex transport system substrate-binding protein